MGRALCSIAAIRAAERSAAHGLPAGTLMLRAGQAAADWIERRVTTRPLNVLFVCGAGNNGGDGYTTALELVHRGHRATCVALGHPSARDAREAADRWSAAGGATLADLPDDWSGFHAVVDAVLGIGAVRPLEGAAARFARLTRRRPVLALDVPSGLNADTGAWIEGEPGVHASATLSLVADKPGLHTGAGVDAAGTVEVATLDVLAPDCIAHLTAPDDFPHLLSARPRDSHKGSFGDVAVVGGGLGMVGAALLAARAALRLGAGRVYVDCVGAPELKLDPLQPELMFRPHGQLHPDAWVVGCGLGTDAQARQVLLGLLGRAGAPLVVDADALTLLAVEPGLAKGLGDACAILTPHPLEAARLLGIDAAEVQRDRLRHAGELASRLRAIVVLKGAGTVIAAPDGRVAINPTGGPALATAGTGDVLAGMLGALLAQGTPAWEAALAAVWLHGAAADASGVEVGLAASDLPARAAAAWSSLRPRAE